MHIIWFTAGIVCALYFIILLIYSGFTSAFYLVWPAMAVCFLLLGWLFHIHFFAQLPPSVRGILLAFVAIGILVFVGVEGMILRAATLDPASGLDYVIVLGAHVRSTGQAGLWLSGWMQPLIMLLITRIPSSSFPADKAPMNLAPKQMP